MSLAEKLEDFGAELTEGLAALPKSFGYEDSLQESPVVVYLLTGATRIGKFFGFSQKNKQLLLRSNDVDMAIDLPDIRYIAFLQQIHGPAMEELPPSHHLLIRFNDNRNYCVEQAYALDSELGLNVFLFKSKNLYRVWVPAGALESYVVDGDCHSTMTENLPFNLADVLHSESNHSEPPVLLDTSFQLPEIACSSIDVINALQHKALIPKHSFGGLLRALNIISEQQLDEALSQQVTRPSVHLGELLKEQQNIDETMISRALAYKLGLPFVSLRDFDIDPMSLSDITHELAMQLHVMPLCFDGRRLVVAMDNPSTTDSVQMLEFIAQKSIDITVATSEDIYAAIEKHYGIKDDIDVYHQLQPLGLEQDDSHSQDFITAEKLSRERPIVRLVNSLLTEAVRNKASDIHIRPGEKHVDLLFRVDSNLVHVRRYSRTIHAAVVSRIKVLGRMDISERRVPQDGRAKISVYNKQVDLRLSIMPTITGESVVIRLLDTSIGLKSLDDIGFEANELRSLKNNCVGYRSHRIG